MTTANRHGDFVWYELLTSDVAAAKAFYGAILPWTFADSGHAAMEYTLVSSPDSEVAGVMAITPEMAQGGARPAWVGYIAVDDADASVAAIAARGGSELMPAMDLEGVGRMAMVADPQGAVFYVMKDTSDRPSHAFAAEAPQAGHCAWNELSTSDPEAAKRFYGELFGWAKDGDLDMGPLGKYEFLKASGGRFVLGAVMPKMPEMPVSAWTFYFRVPDIDRAAATIAEAGGTVTQAPMEIPGGEYALNALDQAGAAFGLVGPRKG
jgi:uncharacterized protein